MIRKINGNIFYISALDFQGDNKKFYITFRTINGVSGFDLVINRKWIDTVGMGNVAGKIELALANPRKAMVNRFGKLIKIHKKLEFYRKKQSEKEEHLFKDNLIKEFKKVENAKSTLIEKFNSLNESGQARALDYLNDLTEMNRYKLGA
ncbi:hypothetical protein ACFO6R_11450 [Eubacterium multiforme]|uniref:Uncharacterized protein n=1 Tax=Eubacterium multiforme TaxID=83339 RepID=A0ABT9UWG9_9FIRM|nr:hypothetical protein [Eubacterium multiforme]MDQ0150677.1 hypothetical protein [Eubacterium multiforme]